MVPPPPCPFIKVMDPDSIVAIKKVINDPYAAVVIQEEVLVTLIYKVFRGSLEIYLIILRDNFMEKIFWLKTHTTFTSKILRFHNFFSFQILKFHSYFMEDVHSERMEQNRLRRCHIYYFLEDDSMMVVEPSVSNSGIPHGKFDIYIFTMS